MTRVEGGTGTNGNVRAGDTVNVQFTIKDKQGRRIALADLASLRLLVSGPIQNYQRVIPQTADARARATINSDGSYSYTFESPMPATYAAPLNDTASFGEDHGELTGQPLASGTYTLGIEAYRSFTIEGEAVRDSGNATFNFLVGDAATMETREVVKQESCNQCHSEIEAHGTIRKDVDYCVTCHTAGSEDRNTPTVADGTPGVSIDFPVMIHKIHSAAHLPSVLGVSTNDDGTRNYAATPRPYEILGFGDRIIDFSHAASPVMPGAYVAFTRDQSSANYTGTGGNGPMPRDVGYTALPAPQKELEDRMRSGLMTCSKCHGDPDGTGPLTAPADGDHAYSNPTRKACGSCHDDVHWDKPYTANDLSMGPQTSDGTCVTCHPPTGGAIGGGALAVITAHQHPFDNPALNKGVNLNITAAAGGSGAGGNHVPGDPIAATFSLKDDAGADLNINRLTRFQLIVTGPTSNPQLILTNVNAFDFAFRRSTPFTGNGTIGSLSFASGARQTIAVVFTSATTFDVVGSVDAPLTGQAIAAESGASATVTYGGVTFTVRQGATPYAAGDRYYMEIIPPAPSYTINVPVDIATEYVGRAGGSAVNVANPPLYWGRQQVWERTAVAAGTGLTAPVKGLAPYLEIDSAQVQGLAAGDRIVVDDGQGNEEYLSITMIQVADEKTGGDLGARDRLWVTPAVRYAHAAGAVVQEVTFSARREGIAYTVSDAARGEITLTAGAFTAGNPIVVSYRTDGRFGFRRGPGDTLQALFPPAGADSDDIGVAQGDWKGLPLTDGTYTVAGWANVDFSVEPSGKLASSVKVWNDIATDLTTYRMISKPAKASFLFGAATSKVERNVIGADTCNKCHGDLQAHGFGRRGYETCEVCHTIPGFEDGQKARFASWYTEFTPSVSMDFRSLLHKVHQGRNLANGGAYEVIGVFLGVPYPVLYDEVGFPVMPAGTADCQSCHGAGSTSWRAPATRNHPAAGAPTQAWTVVCGSCHDDDAAGAHFATQTVVGVEACAVCHGPGSSVAVDKVHATH